MHLCHRIYRAAFTVSSLLFQACTSVPQRGDTGVEVIDVPTVDVPVAMDRESPIDAPRADSPTPPLFDVRVDEEEADRPTPITDVSTDQCAPRPESCDRIDNDCNGVVDDVPRGMLLSDPVNCGMCGNRCGALQLCSDGACIANELASTGAEGDFVAAAGRTTTLSNGRHDFRTFRVELGATVVVGPSAGSPSNSGVLDIRVVGDTSIAGSIELRGGNGGNSPGIGNPMMMPMCNNMAATGGGVGGATATQNDGASFGGCTTVATGGVVNGMGLGTGTSGDRSGQTASCGGIGGANGGGSGGGRRGSGGGGGGGPAGGGGGGAAFVLMGLPAVARGGAGGSIAPNNGGSGGGAGYDAVTGSQGSGGQGGQGPMGFAGTAGATGRMMGSTSAAAGGGGGGSIGAVAANDFAIDTLSVGSGGGAGGGAGDPCPQFGISYGVAGGGGGGGGALRIVTGGTMVIANTATIRTNGGDGGDGSPEVASGGGGGGAGGAIDLRAIALSVASGARIDARGGAGGMGGLNSGAGGAGGVGRVRLAFNNQAPCSVAADAFRHTFANMNNPCAQTVNGAANQVFVTRFPR